MKTIIHLVLLICALAVLPINAATIGGEGPIMKELHLITLTGENNDIGYDESTRRLGNLIVGNDTLCTVEKPFVPCLEAPDSIGGGKPFESSVPLGEYDLVLRESPSKGWQWHFVNPDLHVFLEADDREHDWQRYSTMIHTGNYVRSVVGCIAPGRRIINFGDPDGFGVQSSAVAMRIIKDYLHGESEAKLFIT